MVQFHKLTAAYQFKVVKEGAAIVKQTGGAFFGIPLQTTASAMNYTFF